MVNVCTVVEGRQITDQPHSSDGPPTHVFNEPIVDLCLGCNHHGSAGELAVVKGQEQAWTAVDLFFSIDSQRERPAPEASQRNENGRLIAQFSPSAETSGPQGRNVSREPHSQQIDVMKNSVRMPQ